MSRESSPLHFFKMHGAGNDFVVLDLRESSEPDPALCKLLADRHFGVGCDLILGVEPPISADAVASYRIWTGDGSASRQCGNGARCVASWVRRMGLANERSFVLDSPSGSHRVDVLPDGGIRVALGKPDFEPSSLPLSGFDRPQPLYEVEVDGASVVFAAVSMGNPHAVIEVADVNVAPIAELGGALQASDILPDTVNVGFVQVVSRSSVRLRVHEYGAGETLACGSGACAAAAALMRLERIDRAVRVSMRGGDLEVIWPDEDAEIEMTGPATLVFEGCLEASALSEGGTA